jgi:hypothetical protein
MKTLISARTRRHILKIAAAGIASAPLGACDHDWPNDNNNLWHKHRKKDWNCFLVGTKVSTPVGERPVEQLQIGDHVNTRNGPRPIKWIGYSKIQKKEGSAWNNSVVPIRIATSAIDDGVPRCDLYLSPAHCLFLDNVLIPVIHLVNDLNIVPHVPCGLDEITYFHVEFERHEVIYAEGACVESYLGSNREVFSNWTGFAQIYGTKGEVNKTPFAPIVGYYGGRDEVKGLLRSIISNVIDIRDPIQVAWDRITARAGVLSA